MSAPYLDPQVLREIADYVDALNAVTQAHGEKSGYVQNAPVKDHHGDTIGHIVDEIGGVYQFVPGPLQR